MDLRFLLFSLLDQRRVFFGLAVDLVAVDFKAGGVDAGAEEARGVAPGVLRGAETVAGRVVGVGAWRTRGSTRFIQMFSSRALISAAAAGSTVGAAAPGPPVRN